MSNVTNKRAEEVVTRHQIFIMRLFRLRACHPALVTNEANRFGIDMDTLYNST